MSLTNHKKDSVRDRIDDVDFTNHHVGAAVLMGDPYYGNNKGLRGRKGFLVQNDFLNVLGMEEHSDGDGRDSFSVREDGGVEVEGEPVERLNEEMSRKLTIFPTSSAMQKLGGEGTTAIAESNEINVINPKPLYSIANHKGDQHYLFDKSDAPIPFFVHSSRYNHDSPLDVKRAGDQMTGEFDKFGYEGPVVSKTDNGGRGKEISFFESPRDLQKNWEKKGEVPDNEVIQAKLKPRYDERIIIGGETGGDMVYVTAEKRYGEPDNDLCNLTQVGGDQLDELWFGDKLERILQEGLAAPVNIDELDEAKKDVIEEVYDTVMDYVDTEFGYSDNYRRNFRGSIDLLVWDPDDQNHMPDEMVESLLRYETEDGYGVTPIEWNNQSGQMIDVVNMMYPSQDSAANLAKQMYCISRGEEFSERGLPYNMTRGEMIPEGEIGVQREGNRFFGLYRNAADDLAQMSAEELYKKATSNPRFQ